jgi:hypothetical protein
MRKFVTYYRDTIQPEYLYLDLEAQHAIGLLDAGSSVSSVARSMGVSRASVHQALERAAELP